MELQKAIELISPGTNRFIKKGSWADLGCGKGLFTQALAHLLPEGSTVYAIDKNKKGINDLTLPKHVNLQKLVADFTHDFLPLLELDGILMANSLHFVPDKISFLRKSDQWLRDDGCFLLVEYDTDKPNPWVPYPISFSSAVNLFQQAGYRKVQKLGIYPSLYNRADIYAAFMER